MLSCLLCRRFESLQPPLLPPLSNRENIHKKEISRQSKILFAFMLATKSRYFLSSCGKGVNSHRFFFSFSFSFAYTHTLDLSAESTQASINPSVSSVGLIYSVLHISTICIQAIVPSVQVIVPLSSHRACISSDHPTCSLKGIALSLCGGRWQYTDDLNIKKKGGGGGGRRKRSNRQNIKNVLSYLFIYTPEFYNRA